MTVSSPASAPPSSPSRSVSPTAATIWRWWRAPLLIALILLATSIITVLLTGSGTGRRLDPRDTSLNGAAALAELLREQGVRVEPVSDIASAWSLATRDSLLLVTDTSFLSQADIRRLSTLPSDRLLVGPDFSWGYLAPGIEVTAEQRVRSREPGCTLPAARRAGSAHIGGVAMKGPSWAIGCYATRDGASLLTYRFGQRQITLVGDGDFMTNLRLAENGNAALAMNLAGSRPTLIWLVAPDEPPELAGPDGRSLNDLIPEGVPWAVVQLVIAVALVAIWRGRRLGPVVTERLPVVVRAAETVEGRGRLYHARRARDRAAAALRAGTLHRIVPTLGLPPNPGQSAIISAISERTGQDGVQVANLLYGPPPPDDAALVVLADHLDTLERQVKQS